jgi:hypothetical protein
MSHHDLENAIRSTDPSTAFTCARLHLRNGKRRLQKGHRMEGMIALFDAVLFGMRYYVTKHKQCAAVVENIDLWDATNLYQALTRAGVFDDPLAFNRFNLLVERALWQKSYAIDAVSMLVEVEKILLKLGVISSSEYSLPGESPLTIL